MSVVVQMDRSGDEGRDECQSIVYLYCVYRGALRMSRCGVVML